MTTVLDVDGPAAPPRSNGELVFAEPWEGRAFGLTMALADGGVVAYDAFREALMARIAAWEQHHDEREVFSYYLCWLQALEHVLDQQDLVRLRDVAERSAVFARRPAGHDHSHDHDLSHDHGTGRDDGTGDDAG
jgi:nitrile hydratase accessory protein